MDLHHRLAENALREFRDPGEDVIDERLILGEMLPPFLRDLIDLLAAFFGQRAGIAQILEHRQSRIDGTRTRRVHPSKTLFDFLDDLVAVARLLIEQPEYHELEMPLIEHPAATEWTAPRLAAPCPERPGIEPEVLRPR